MEQEMVSPSAPEINSGQRTEPEQAIVEATEMRMLEAVKLLSRNCPPEILPEIALEQLLTLRPHLKEALEALEDLKGRRSLTDKERSQHYTFKMLLACRE